MSHCYWTTIGDLALLYFSADLAYIGGSLVPEGGHNPLEAARAGCPVMFGPHMEDFSEIARDLVAEGGARTVSAAALAETAAAILDDTAVHAAMSKAARDVVEQHRGARDALLAVAGALLRAPAGEAPYLLG